ncbi:MAG: ATP-dependent DNA helicase RecG [Candidatus Binataceae bacterium]
MANRQRDPSRDNQGAPAPARRAAPPPLQTAVSSALDVDVANLKGIGPKRALALRNRAIVTYRDALMHLPYRYIDLRQRHGIAELARGDMAVVTGTLSAVSQRPMRNSRWRQIATATLADSAGGRLRVVWFNLPSYARFPSGEQVLLYGRVTAGTDGKLEIIHPELHRLRDGEAPAIRAVYSLPLTINRSVFALIISEALKRLDAGELGSMPESVRTSAAVQPIADALRYLHRPPTDADIEALEYGDTAAHRALALDEMFAFQLALCRERARFKRRAGAALNNAAALTTDFMAGLPFTPTRAQLSAIEEIGAALAEPMQMNRLLIGDVGSGKTMVAFWAALRAVESGYQAAMMAPTELLAEQHHASFQRLCGRLGVRSAMLTGQVTGAARGRLMRLLENGGVEIVFGTQALIQEQVRMRRLGLAIIDEQHRFGVFDRARLMALGAEVNVMLMTATPIPRSLALTLFRNLEVSSLDEMPPGRTPVATAIFAEAALSEVDALVREELRKGNRAYYVVPLIDGEEEDLDSVAAMAKRLGRGALTDFRIGTLHGRMRPAEKDRVMREFRDGAVDVLVSTTVVEVGIDVPAATVIVVMAAERYGLAQLHQLRGRVGRGAAASRCCLVVSGESDARVRDRLGVLARSQNGAEVAHADLRLRGPGDLLGTRQTGALPLRFARFIRDFALIDRAGDLAEQWLRHDPGLERPESAAVRVAIARMLDLGFSLGDVG